MKDYSSFVKSFEAYLSAHKAEGLPDTLYAPIRYINQLGGKRIRPALLLMAYHQWHDDITPALPAALAVEYFHNFSLMHDDIMDEAVLRRGSESVHLKFGRNAAILSGDAMLIRCFELLLEAGRNNNKGATLCSLMAGAATAICEGQQIDMDFEHLDSPSEQEYLEMIRKKTACLLGTCLRIGALLAGSSDEEADILYECGEKIGISFQIKDDILDVFGESDVTGKQKGGDILRGKKNFLYVHTYNKLNSIDQKDFTSRYNKASETGEINSILGTYQSLRVEEYAQQMQEYYLSQAMDCLNRLNIPNISSLKSFARELMSRDH